MESLKRTKPSDNKSVTLSLRYVNPKLISSKASDISKLLMALTDLGELKIIRIC